ncbi:MAG: hypothetical protein K8F91_04920, partial [Candidatus Obscuribacterales bacterium]|nr:hypothetical protein [Candidatus Obscuribacterales bacterium]
MNSQAIDKSESAGSRGRKDHYDRYYSYNRYSGLALILLSLSFACSIIADASCLSFLAPLTVFNGPSETDTVSYTFSSVLLLVILIYPMICLSRFRAGS